MSRIAFFLHIPARNARGSGAPNCAFTFLLWAHILACNCAQRAFTRVWNECKQVSLSWRRFLADDTDDDFEVCYKTRLWTQSTYMCAYVHIDRYTGSVTQSNENHNAKVRTRDYVHSINDSPGQINVRPRGINIELESRTVISSITFNGMFTEKHDRWCDVGNKSWKLYHLKLSEHAQCTRGRDKAVIKPRRS